MFTLALLLALSSKPTLVCVGFIDARCDVIYASLDQALTRGPDQSIVVAARTEHVWPTLTAIDRSGHNNEVLMRQELEMQQRLMNAAKAAIFRREYGDRVLSQGLFSEASLSRRLCAPVACCAALIRSFLEEHLWIADNCCSE